MILRGQHICNCFALVALTLALSACAASRAGSDHSSPTKVQAAPPPPAPPPPPPSPPPPHEDPPVIGGGAAPPMRAVTRRVVRRASASSPTNATAATAGAELTASPAARPPLCSITKTRLLTSVCDELKEQNDLTQAGVDAAPTNLKLKLKQPFTYTYSIGAKGAASVVRRNVETGSGAVTAGTVAFGHFNYARLTGDGTMKIEPLDSEVQDTVANPTPVWRWKLTAMEPGARQLALDAGVELRAEGHAPVRLGQNSKRIDVSVDVSGIEKIADLAGTADMVMGLSTNFLKQLAVLLGAAGAAFAAFRALRGRGKSDAKS